MKRSEIGTELSDTAVVYLRQRAARNHKNGDVIFKAF